MAELQQLLISTDNQGPKVQLSPSFTHSVKHSPKGMPSNVDMPGKGMPDMSGMMKNGGPPPMNKMMDSLIDKVMNDANNSKKSDKSPQRIHEFMAKNQNPSLSKSDRLSPTEFIKQRKAQIKEEHHIPVAGGASNIPSAKSPLDQIPDNLGSIELHLHEARLPLSPERAQLVDQVIESVVDAHMTTCNYTALKVTAGMKKYEELKASGNIPMPGGMPGKPGMMPPMSGKCDMGMMPPMGAKPGMSGMPPTNGMPGMGNMPGGMNGGGPSKMWGQFVQNMVPVITRVVNFSKKLPGFNDLSHEDQIKLIKQGSFEVILTRYTPLFQEDGMFIPNMEMKIPLPMIKHMPMGAFFQTQLDFSQVFNPLGLEDGEKGLLTALMIMCPDRNGLDNDRAICKLQGLYLQALYQYMKRLRQDNYDQVFKRAINTLPILQQINDSHTKQVTGANVQTPTLHQEMYVDGKA